MMASVTGGASGLNVAKVEDDGLDDRALELNCTQELNLSQEDAFVTNSGSEDRNPDGRCYIAKAVKNQQVVEMKESWSGMNRTYSANDLFPDYSSPFNQHFIHNSQMQLA